METENLISNLYKQPEVGGAKNASSGDALLGDFNSFIKLLTVQLENQDPLNPTDSTDFTNQLVSFSIANQSLQSNEYLSQLVKLQSVTHETLEKQINPASQLSSLMQFIGKEASARGDSAMLHDGKANFFYSLDEMNDDIRIEVLNSAEEVIWSESIGPKESGVHSFTWHGRNQKDKFMPDGKYNIRVQGNNRDDDISCCISGVVEAATMHCNKPALIINGVVVYSSQLNSVNS